MSYHSHSFLTEDDLMNSGREFAASNGPEYDLEFDPGTSDGQFWQSSRSTCHSPEECQECRSYSDHLQAASFDPSYASSSSQHFSSSFTEGIRVGRRIQQEEDGGILSRYRSRLQWAQMKHKESSLLKTQYRSQVEILERELVAVKDRLMAVQMAYEDLAMARVDDMPSAGSGWGSASRWVDDARDVSARSSSPLVSTSDFEDVDIPLVVRETLGPNEFPSHFLQDEDDFEILQQLHLMDDREKETNIFWSDFRSQSFSDDESDGLDNSSSESDNESSPSPPSSLSSVTNSSVENIALDDSDSEILPNVVQSPTDSTESILDISQLSALMSAAHESGNTAALKRVKVLIKEAERIPRSRRTAAQLYLLLHWRSPSRSPNSSPPLLPITIRLPDAVQSTSALRTSSSPPEIFVDASAHGIGFVFNNRWLAWKFKASHPSMPTDSAGKVIMSWAELIAVELGILTLLAGGYRDMRVVVRSDNEGVVSALTKKTWSASHGLGAVLGRVLRLAAKNGLEVKAKWVWTKTNPADGPSRGVYPPKEMLLEWAPEVPEYLVGVVRQVVRD